jgi:hypothetical protein
MKFSEAIDHLRLGHLVQHQDWEPTSKLWWCDQMQILRVSTRRGDFIFRIESADLMSDGWRLCAPEHDVLLHEEAAWV